MSSHLVSWAESLILSIHNTLNKMYVSGAISWAEQAAPGLLDAVRQKEDRLNGAFKALHAGSGSAVEFEEAALSWETAWRALVTAANGAGSPALPPRSENGNNKAAAALFSVRASDALQPEVVLVTSPDDLRAALSEAAAAGVCGVDTETVGPGKKGGLDPQLGEVRLVQLAVPSANGVKVFVVDMYEVRDFSPLWDFLADDGVLKVFHNAKFDLKFFRKHLGRRLPPGRLFDTMLASQLLACGLDIGSHSLAACYAKLLGFTLDKEERLSDWSRELSVAQVEYAAKDAAVLLPLAAEQIKGLAREGLNRVAKIEFDCCYATADMEYHGLPFDVRRCQELLEKEEEREKGLRANLMKELSPALSPGLFGVAEINPNSPAQLLPALRAVGLDVPDTMDDTLKLLYPDHPAVKALLEYRKCGKRVSAFLKPYMEAVHPVTGRIHANFVQLNKNGVGRFSCREPNVQQSPNEKEFRELFAAPPGKRFVACDYSQIELRIMAWLSKDPRMIEAYRKGEDLHTLTAAMTAGVSPEQVTKMMRQRAKACNFGMIYGMSARTFRQYAKTGYGVDLSEEEAAALREAFFRAYSGVAAWHKKQKAFVQANRFVRTVSGRKRKWPEGKEIPVTQAFNTPDQGTGADILKTAMIYIYHDLFRSGAENCAIVNSVHDELVLECPEGRAEEIAQLVKEKMEAAWYDLMGDAVPVKAEPVIGASWADK